MAEYLAGIPVVEIAYPPAKAGIQVLHYVSQWHWCKPPVRLLLHAHLILQKTSARGRHAPYMYPGLPDLTRNTTHGGVNQWFLGINCARVTLSKVLTGKPGNAAFVDLCVATLMFQMRYRIMESQSTSRKHWKRKVCRPR